MIGRLFGKKPNKVWVIQQIDDGVLHLCGQGVLVSSGKPQHVRTTLWAGQFQDGVRIGDTGIIINAQRIAAIVPLDRLKLVEDSRLAEWQGRLWTVAQVPQRCWGYEGHLITEKIPMSDASTLFSTEDVSHISKQVDRDKAPPGEVVFRPANALEDPLQDTRAAIKEVQERRKQANKGWREDGSWGPLGEPPEK